MDESRTSFSVVVVVVSVVVLLRLHRSAANARFCPPMGNTVDPTDRARSNKYRNTELILIFHALAIRQEDAACSMLFVSVRRTMHTQLKIHDDNMRARTLERIMNKYLKKKMKNIMFVWTDDRRASDACNVSK